MKIINTNKSFKFALAGALTLLVSSANASVIEGVGAFTAVGTAGHCPSFCTELFSYTSDGDEGSTQAYSELNEYAYGQAYSSFVSESYMPLLRVETNAAAYKNSLATAFSVQNFTNTGTETKTVNLDVNLHGSVSDNSSDNHNTDNYLSASIAILGGTSLDWYPNFATLVYEIGQRLIDPMGVYIGDGVDVNNSETVTFTVNAGESFYIVSEMRAKSQDGYADAWNTLSMSFKDGSDLQAAIQVATAPVSVPEPKTLFLLALCLLAILVKKRDLLA
ncbi:hypothetical protein [uncultured Psychromonas sp.]|uniref:hypothetical protein n=1 Tax=uncultured Psychromonas sp. TaxID=173974 RepID=UPI00260A2390|nr:hypothetical protein [uncultured Psychromonas sp.]